MKTIFFLLAMMVANANAQQISPQLVGTNLWYTNPSDTVWKLTENCGVSVVRIGGHAYDKKLPSNEILVSWVKKIQSIGAEPIMQVSQYKSAEVAAELVRFFNIEKHEGIQPIKYWNIGNEPWLQANKPDAKTFAAAVERYFKPIAAAMKMVDSTIKIYGPDECDYMDYYNDLFGGKNDITGNIPGHTYYYCDGLVAHRYPQGNGDPAVEGANDMLKRIIKSKAKVDAVNTLHNRTGDNAVIWGLGEYNSKGGAEVHTWGNGQMFGSVLGYSMQYGAKYVASWSMFEHGGDRKGSDFSFIDGKQLAPRASYWHMQFVAKYFKGLFLKGTTQDTAFQVYGANDGKQISVMIMNRGFGEAKPYTLYLKERNDSMPTLNIFIDAKQRGIYQDVIAPRTTQVLIFKGKSVTKINYSSTDFDNLLPPVYSQASKNFKAKK